MLFPIAGSVVFLMIASPASAKDAPVNMAGYTTVTLAEAGLSQMPEHPPSGTATSPECARAVRRGGQTTTVEQSLPQCQAATSRQPPARKQR